MWVDTIAGLPFCMQFLPDASWKGTRASVTHVFGGNRKNSRPQGCLPQIKLNLKALFLETPQCSIRETPSHPKDWISGIVTIPPRLSLVSGAPQAPAGQTPACGWSAQVNRSTCRVSGEQ